MVLFTGGRHTGKSLLARKLEGRLIADGRHAYLLDGENLRRGLDADLNEYEIDALLVNWGRWAWGMPAHVSWAVSIWPATAPEVIHDPQTVLPVDIDSAHEMEDILLELRHRRPKLWRAVVFRYLLRFVPNASSRNCGAT